jgi:hypothetical protein
VKVQTDSSLGTHPLDVSAGAGGKGGVAGAVGAGGPPGGDGETKDFFWISSDCENMGPVPNFGSPGATPSPGSYGNGRSGNPGIAQFFITGPK